MSFNEKQQQQLRHLISRMLDDDLSAEEVQQLEQWLARDKEALTYYLEFAEIHASLAWATSAPGADADELSDDSPCQVELPRPRASAKLVRFFQQRVPLSFTIAALTIGMLITGMAFMVAPYYRPAEVAVEPPQPEIQIVARLTGKSDAVWEEGQLATHRGAYLQAGHSMRLREGLVEITYSDGARVILQGPADFEVSDAGRGTLKAGKLTARVPKQAIGFTVALPTSEIVDLGTKFAASVADDGQQEVHVLKGRVEVFSNGRATRTLLSGGQALHLEANGSVVQRITTDASQFVADMPDRLPRDNDSTVANQILAADGATVVDSLPLDETTGTLATSEQPVLFHEATGVTLNRVLEVDMTTPGTWRKGATDRLRGGAKVDVYFVHFHPAERKTARGEIRFPARVIGIIGSGARLAASESQLGLNVPRDASSTHLTFGLDNDHLELLSNGRTVRFELVSSGVADDFRVLVASNASNENQQEDGP